MIVVVEENRDAGHIIGSPQAPYLNQLADQGLRLTDMHGEAHPSQPNYLALLSGSTQGLTTDSCPHTYRTDNLAHQLLDSNRSVAAYSEGLPHTGYSGCATGQYVRRHAPRTDFADLPSTVNRPLTTMPSDPADLPALAFVIPDLVDDMHSGTIARGDRWLRQHVGAYATWARSHRSLLLVTWDEDENTATNHIATIAVGDGIAAGTWTHPANHYSILAALERSFGLPPLGQARHMTDLPPIS